MKSRHNKIVFAVIAIAVLALSIWAAYEIFSSPSEPVAPMAAAAEKKTSFRVGAWDEIRICKLLSTSGGGFDCWYSRQRGCDDSQADVPHVGEVYFQKRWMVGRQSDW